MKISIYGSMGKQETRIEQRYPQHKFYFCSSDTNSRETIHPHSTYHILLIKFINHNIFKLLRSSVPDNKIIKVNGGMSQLFTVIDGLK